MSVIVLEDAVLRQLAANPANLTKFPFLRAAQQQPASCCGGGPPPINFNSIKQAAVNLPTDKLAELKKILGATKLRAMFHLNGTSSDVTV